MAIPYRMPQNNAVISSAATGRESQEQWLRNQALLGQMGPEQAIAAGGGGMTRGPNGESIPMGVYRSMGMGGGGGYGSGGSFFDQWNNAYQTARNANEARYEAIRGPGPSAPATGGRVSARLQPQQPAMTGDQLAARGGYAGRFDRNMGRLETLGAQEKADVSQRYDQQAAAGQQSLTNRGLANSTVLNTMKLGTQREKSDALSRVNERLQRERIDTDARLSGDTLAFMERRTDSYPDQRLYAQMAQAAGQAGMGGGGYGAQGGYPVFATFGGGGYGMGGGWGAYPMWGGGGMGGGGRGGRDDMMRGPLPPAMGGGGESGDIGGGLNIYRKNTTTAPSLDPYWTLPSWERNKYVASMESGGPTGIADLDELPSYPSRGWPAAPPGGWPSTGSTGGYSMGPMPGFGPASSDPAGLFTTASSGPPATSGGFHGLTRDQLLVRQAAGMK